MEQDLRIADLILAYIQGKITAPESAELNAWLSEKPEHRLIFQKIVNEQNLDFDLAALKGFDTEAALKKIKEIEPIVYTPKPYPFRWARIAAAASVLLAISAGGYFLLHKKQAGVQTAHIQKQDIAPGQRQPILTLSGGQQIVLNGRNGQLAVQGGASISKTNGQLVYQQQTAGADEPVTYNTVTNPRGSEALHLVLTDGTEAWLNAASSITYPTEFNGKKRNIQMTGEVAFNVKYKKEQPFIVTANGQTTIDLGTTFDIKAYADEPQIKTSLLEGSISITKDKQTKIIKPGQQALAGSSISVKAADMDEAFAWKNGYFVFNDENIQDIMRDISRWYDVEVSYQGDMSGKEFVGSVSRFKNVSEVLRKLEETGTVHFKTEGRRITVME